MKNGMCANHAISGEIFYRKSRMTRSENYYPTLSSLWPDNYSLGVLVFITSSYLDINIFRVSGCIETMSGDNKANSIDMAYWN